MIIDSNFIKKFGDSFSKEVKLSNYSWFNLGGNADFFFKAKDKSQLIEFLSEAKKKNLQTTILGAGSNTLIRDNGVRGVVVKLVGNFSYTKLISDNILSVGAATLDRKVANFAKDNNLGNFEFLSCIPGSIGGAIIMNSGCYDNDISKVLLSIQVIDKNNLKEISSLINSIKLIENINPNILNSNDEKWLKQVTIRLRLTKSQSIILEKYFKGNKIRNSETFYPIIPEFDQNSKSERNKLFQNILAELAT